MERKFQKKQPEKRKYWFRLIFWTFVILAILFCLNIPVIDRMDLKTFMGLANMYIVVLWCYLWLSTRAKWWNKIYIFLLGTAVFVGTQYLAYVYVYYILPQVDIKLFSRPIDGYVGRFVSRSSTSNFLLIAMAVVDYYFWDRLAYKFEIAKLEKKAKDNENSYMLSVHFIQNMIDIAWENMLARRRDVFKFFTYIFSNFARKRNKISLKEEWSNLLLVVEICSHRKYHVSGEDSLSPEDWNRSIPAFSLLTWMENAIQYSPENNLLPIEITLSKSEQMINITIANHMTREKSRDKLQGQGLMLVNELLDDPTYQVRYQTTSDGRFVLMLTIK